MKNILVPIDGSDTSLRAIKKAKEVANLSGGKITLLYICDIKAAKSFLNFDSDKTIQLQVQMVEKAEDVLASGKEMLAELGDRVSTVMLEGNPAEEILNYVHKNKYDLAIIGAFGSSGYNISFIGTIARKVITGIEIPILVVH